MNKWMYESKVTWGHVDHMMEALSLGYSRSTEFNLISYKKKLTQAALEYTC